MRPRGMTGHAGVMPDRPFPAVDEMIRRVKRGAADRPDPVHILAQMISIVGESDADPYAVLGVLAEGAAYTLAEYFPPERQAETAVMLIELLQDRLKARG